MERKETFAVSDPEVYTNVRQMSRSKSIVPCMTKNGLMSNTQL